MYFFLLPILTKGIKAKLNEIESESDIFPLETKKMNYYYPITTSQLYIVSIYRGSTSRHIGILVAQSFHSCA